MRALVTGASGFVGKYLVERLTAMQYEVCAAGGPHDGGGYLPIDLRDRQSVDAAFDLARPDVVFHLAAQSFVPRAIEDPDETYGVNVRGTLNVAHALREHVRRTGQKARLLFTSSAHVYGTQPQQALPLREATACSPGNPYAASKAAAEALLLGEARTFGLDVIVTRAFNHIGPGQDQRFAVPSFAAQLARIKAGASAQLQVGDLSTQRDFLDVRDVVAAYTALAERGRSGEIYNVCSGVPVAMREVLGELIRIAHVAVEVREDPARLRSSDDAVLYGSNEKLAQETGWSPQIPLRRTLQDIYSSVEISAS